MAVDPKDAQNIVDKAVAEGKDRSFVTKLSNRLGLEPQGLDHPTNLQIKTERDNLLERMIKDGLSNKQQEIILNRFDLTSGAATTPEEIKASEKYQEAMIKLQEARPDLELPREKTAEDAAKEGEITEKANIYDKRFSKQELEQFERNKETFAAAEAGDISASQSVQNTMTNAIGQLSTVDDRIKWLYGSITGDDEARAEANRVLDKQERQYAKPTIGFTDLSKQKGAGNKILGFMAAGANALTSFGTSALEFAVIPGGGLLWADILASTTRDYNNFKAEALGKTQDELIRDGEHEYMAPLAASGVMFALERIGLGKVLKQSRGKAFFNVLKNMPPGSLKAVADAGIGGTIEATTEWFQGAVEQFSELHAKGDDEAFSKSFQWMGSKEGIETLLQGFVGGGGIRAKSSVKNIGAERRSIASKEKIERANETIKKIDDQMQNRNLSDAERTALSQARNAAAEDKRQAVIDPYRDLVNLRADEIEAVSKTYTKIGELKQNVLDVQDSTEISDDAKEEVVRRLEENIAYHEAASAQIIEKANAEAAAEQENKVKKAVEAFKNKLTKKTADGKTEAPDASVVKEREEELKQEAAQEQADKEANPVETVIRNAGEPDPVSSPARKVLDVIESDDQTLFEEAETRLQAKNKELIELGDKRQAGEITPEEYNRQHDKLLSERKKIHDENYDKYGKPKQKQKKKTVKQAKAEEKERKRTTLFNEDGTLNEEAYADRRGGKDKLSDRLDKNLTRIIDTPSGFQDGALKSSAFGLENVAQVAVDGLLKGVRLAVRKGAPVIDHMEAFYLEHKDAIGKPFEAWKKQFLQWLNATSKQIPAADWQVRLDKAVIESVEAAKNDADLTQKSKLEKSGELKKDSKSKKSVEQFEADKEKAKQIYQRVSDYFGTLKATGFKEVKQHMIGDAVKVLKEASVEEIMGALTSNLRGFFQGEMRVIQDGDPLTKTAQKIGQQLAKGKFDEFNTAKQIKAEVALGFEVLQGLFENNILALQKDFSQDKRGVVAFQVTDPDAFNNFLTHADVALESENVTPDYTKPQYEKPQEWNSMRHPTGLSLVGKRDKLQHMSQKDYPRVYEVINKAQGVPYQMSTRMLDVFKQVQDAEMFTFKKEFDKVKAEFKEKLEAVKDDPKRTRRVKKQRKAALDAIQAKKNAVNAIIVAGDNIGDRSFHEMHNYDFRGRIYPMTRNIQHTGSKITLSMYQFANKKPIGTAGWKWMLVQAADVLGEPLITFEDRFDYANSQLGKWMEIARDPVNNREWENAEYPGLFLATIMEIQQALESGDPLTYESGLPIHMDATNSGGQILSAMIKDQEGAKHVNLTNDHKKGDLYLAVARQVWGDKRMKPPTTAQVAKAKERLEEIEDLRYLAEEANTPEAWAKYKEEAPFKERQELNAVLAREFFNRPEIIKKYQRKMAKKPVMTYFYSAGPKTMGVGIYNEFSHKEGFEDMTPLMAQYIAELLYEGTQATMPKASALMTEFISAGVKSVAGGEPTSWHTPVNGFKVVQNYQKVQNKSTYVSKKHGYKGANADEVLDKDGYLNLSIINKEAGIDKMRYKTASAPNVVHSFDSQIPAWLFLNAQYDVQSIHDSFGAVPGDADLLYADIRRSFVDIFGQDRLTQLFSEMVSPEYAKQVMSKITFGELNIDETLANPNAFSAGEGREDDAKPSITPEEQAHRDQEFKDHANKLIAESRADLAVEEAKACKI